MINVNNHSLSNLRRALVFFSISFTSPRDSTFNRTTGSVLEERRLKRQSAKVMLMPSVRSTASASRLKCCSTRLIASTGCASLLLISPLDGNAANPANDLRLRSGDKIVITGLPANTKLKAAETNDTDDRYSVSASGNGSSLTLKDDVNNTGESLAVGNNGTAELDAEYSVQTNSTTDKIVFTSTLRGVSVTGFLFNIAPFVFITIAGVGLLVLVMRNKKSSDSKSKI